MATLGGTRLHRICDEGDSMVFVEAARSSEQRASPHRADGPTSSDEVSRSSSEIHVVVQEERADVDGVPLEHVLDMTDALQKEQAEREADEQLKYADEVDRLRRVRNAKWEAVKARLRSQAAFRHNVRAYDSDLDTEEEEEDGDEGVESRRTPEASELDPLRPSLSEERAVNRGPVYVVESVPQRISHFLYNWFVFVVYALSASAMPGLDVAKGTDAREYYDHRCP